MSKKTFKDNTKNIDRFFSVHDEQNESAEQISSNNSNDTANNKGNANNRKKNQEYKKQTYYLTDEIIEAIRTMAYQTRKDKSELVRELLENSQLKDYF